MNDRGTTSAIDPTRAAAELLQGLERLRDAFRQRLDRVEALARERAEAPREESAREGVLQRRIAELEQDQARSRTAAEGFEVDRRTLIERLEHDRRLLADSWERLEREQIEASAPAQLPHPPAPDLRQTTPPSPASAPDSDDPVERTLLQQFQSLQRDVRRTARARTQGQTHLSE